MLNFQFQNRTKILFGKGQIASIGEEIPADARVMLTYGGGSIKSNGVYAQVIEALAGRTVLEFGGIEPNPEYVTLMKAVEQVRREPVDMLLAVGGGSVLDGTKFIAAAAPCAGEPWDFVRERGAGVTSAVPLGTVLTLSATGSESNPFAVISRRETSEKLAFASPHLYPRFAVLDPETTFSLPLRQVANGVVDAFVHAMEQYMTYPANAELQDRLAEAILLTLIEVGPTTLAQPRNYDARANLVWTATLALNGLIGVGVPQDWSTHLIGHELTVLYGIDHARTLAVVFPHLLRVQTNQKRDKLLRYGAHVWGLAAGAPEEKIERAIVKTEEFFESLEVPTRLAVYGVPKDTPDIVADRLQKRGLTNLGERADVTPSIVKEILERSLQAS